MASPDQIEAALQEATRNLHPDHVAILAHLLADVIDRRVSSI
jgi:hypothetical protein